MMKHLSLSSGYLRPFYNGKQPKTFYTDQDFAMGKAVEEVFQEAWHGLCTFHIVQNAIKHLPKQEKEKDSNIVADFSACMYQYEDKETFEREFAILRTKVEKQTWLDSIYKLKEKWAECYMKHVYTLGMRSSQLSESLNNDLKIHFKSDFDIIRFLKHFERVVQGKRNNELNSEFESRKKIPWVKVKIPMLLQARKLYTPIIFEAFQGQYERSMIACTKVLDGNNEYLVTTGSLSEDLILKEEYKVIGNPVDQTAICSCNLFNRIGVICAHALNVLDLMNIKLLPTHYILKRWTRQARSGTILDKNGRNVIENPKFDAMRRYRYFSHKLLNLAHQAAYYPECTQLVDSTIDLLSQQIEDKITSCTSIPSEDQPAAQVDVAPPNDALSNAQLKKKEVHTKSSKRHKFGWENKHKGRKKEQSKTLQVQVQMAQTIVEEASNGNEKESEGYRTISSFTRLLTGVSSDDLEMEGLF